MPLFFARLGSVRASRIAKSAVRPRGPHLLAGHDPLVAVAHRAGRERREVGARARLAEQLAPLLLVAHDRREEAPLLLLGAVREQRRRGVVEPERVERGRGCTARAPAHRARGSIGRHAEPAVLGAATWARPGPTRRTPGTTPRSRRRPRTSRMAALPPRAAASRHATGTCSSTQCLGAADALLHRRRRIDGEAFVVHGHNVRASSHSRSPSGPRNAGYAPALPVTCSAAQRKRHSSTLFALRGETPADGTITAGCGGDRRRGRRRVARPASSTPTGAALEAAMIREALDDAGLTLADVDGVCCSRHRHRASPSTSASTPRSPTAPSSAARASRCTSSTRPPRSRPGCATWSSASTPSTPRGRSPPRRARPAAFGPMGPDIAAEWEVPVRV